ncbi:PTS system mannitol-specific transporter subunit IIC [Clostridium sartagoforme AAU1]|jgi:mannitol PTS system EIICBA or EIICB component|uniref:Mannitol-specific phosphotransferase enzyme IIA component n=1 Tax=Clostridium sartagoforme AAU1 TaxID=1202534 RepID=R9CF95_9CLOT|nr:PTS mannitol transporter subunit IICBA [Clostridium sartagoforme]EOR28024.1 PTS system mannitol-specific transporter subunit IIC [Clostridium sartagoforme AAU1]
MIKDNIQKFGKFLSAMVMPNIGAFISWGLVTAFFIPTGWMPNESLGELVDPILKYLLPLMVGMTGGYVVAGKRGGVMAAIATMGVIVGVEIPMFIGAMVIGPIAGFTIKKFDELIKDKVPAGFEMLVNNFSIGILGVFFVIIGFKTIGPIILVITTFLKNGAEVIIQNGLISLVSIFIEPAKVLFLNNAINHGVLGPIGIEQVQETGKSIMFLLESNPGPGLGVILAYLLYGKGVAKQSASGAAIIHFLGGIHEIYFPYILMNPALIISVIAGGAAGAFTFSVLGAGLVATPSPGSIFALVAMSPKGGIIQVLLGVIVAIIVSFIIAVPLVKRAAKNEEKNDKQMEEKEGILTMETTKEKEVKKETIKKIVFACDAGMGSSAMGATKLRNRIKSLDLDIEVANSSVDTIPKDADIVVSHVNLVERAKRNSPNAEHIFIESFLKDDKIEELFKRLEEKSKNNLACEVKSEDIMIEEKLSVLSEKNILLGLKSETKEEAIERAGKLLVSRGYVKEEYIDAMQERERVVSTYIGMGVAIPHGIGEAKRQIEASGIVVLQYPEGVNFGEELAYLVIGIAGVGDEHLEILSNIAISLEDLELVDRLSKTENKKDILDVFQK